MTPYPLEVAWVINYFSLGGFAAGTVSHTHPRDIPSRWCMMLWHDPHALTATLHEGGVTFHFHVGRRRLALLYRQRTVSLPNHHEVTPMQAYRLSSSVVWLTLKREHI